MPLVSRIGIVPGDSGAPVFDLAGIGRVAVFTCFDANFEELWWQAGAQAMDIVLFPAAFPGGYLIRAYAALHAYYVAANGNGDFIDVDGTTLSNVTDYDGSGTLRLGRFDLDRAVVHPDDPWNSNMAKLSAVMGSLALKGKIVVDRDSGAESNRVIIKSVD